MNYRSRTGFGRVQWPWWHDAIIIAAMFAAMYIVSKVF